MKRVLFAVAMTVALTAPLVAQRETGAPRRNQLTNFKDALGLTDAQAEAIRSMAQAQQPNVQAIRTEIEQKRQALDDLLNAASPSAVDVGNAALALRASEKRLEGQRTALINQIKQQLTGEQQQKLDTLLAANGGRGLRLPGLDPAFGPGPGPGPRGERR
jgi:Spy/CpxP family protein refolding chaperone